MVVILSDKNKKNIFLTLLLQPLPVTRLHIQLLCVSGSLLHLCSARLCVVTFTVLMKPNSQYACPHLLLCMFVNIFEICHLNFTCHQLLSSHSRAAALSQIYNYQS